MNKLEKRITGLISTWILRYVLRRQKSFANRHSTTLSLATGAIVMLVLAWRFLTGQDEEAPMVTDEVTTQATI